MNMVPDDNPIQEDDAPFEWLTNFRSLRHLVSPSRIISGESSHSDDWMERPPIVRLNALHVGCGSSTVGESLLCVRERTRNHLFQYDHVVNVDNDKAALHRMQKRWEKRHAQRRDANAAAQSDEMSRMEWKYLDFKIEETCRLALGEGEGCFDLVFDKSTLDCLLCAETRVAAQFLREVYRALRVPASAEKTNENTDARSQASWGGVYLLVTFHPVEFVERLLTQLPGANWQIEHEVIKREMDDLEEGGAWSIDEMIPRPISGCIDALAEKDAVSPSLSAWSSGTFRPDENYRKTVTVFTCRRYCTNPRKDNSSPLPCVLDHDQVCKHIEKTCDEWYKQTNPMVTREREGKLRVAFAEAAAATHVTTNRQRKDKSAPEDFVVDLERCYELIFTDEERDHLTYEYFLEDWGAYCKLASKVDALHPHEGMTVTIALDFLKEMQ